MDKNWSAATQIKERQNKRECIFLCKEQSDLLNAADTIDNVTI